MNESDTVKITASQALGALQTYIHNLEDENESLEAEVDRLSEEVDTLRENIKDWYKPRSPYESLGMSRSDFI